MEARELIKLMVIAAIISTAVAIVSTAIFVTSVNYKFNSAVHGHVENAYFSSDPITMRDELNKAIQGMHDLGLTDEMYNALFPWQRTPNNRMDWQYKHMQSIQNRINEWQEWEESQTNSGSQQMQDVNTQKLDNVRTFIKSEGWSDDVAQGAYVVNMHFSLLLAFWGSLGSGVVAILAIGGIIFVVSRK